MSDDYDLHERADMGTDADADESPDTGALSDASEELVDYLLTHKPDAQRIYSEVFRVRRPYGSAARRSLQYLKRWNREIPIRDMIARLWGAGEYLLRVYYGQGRARRCETETIVIDPDYVPDADSFAAEPVRQIAAAPQQAAMDGGLAYVVQAQQQMVATMVEIVKAALSRPDTGNGMERMSRALESMIVRNAEAQTSLVNRMIESRAIAAGVSEEPDGDVDPPENPWIDFLRGLWAAFGDRLLQGGRALAAMARPVVQSDERFGQLMAAPEQYAEAYQALTRDVPRENVDRVLGMLGIPLPGAVAENQPGAAPE